MKVETHNHPTAISPYPGAATGSGGEIRDEGATGRGAKPKAGLTGFSVSNLRIPGFEQPWEKEGVGRPSRIASALQIMIEGPIGGAAFNNEFGRPNLAGYFRTYEQRVAGEVRGYHKPIMIAGGVGSIASAHTAKSAVPEGALIIQLGGPAMLIGLGGGAASSMGTGTNVEDLDFDSVQRGNAEIQRRAQEVIDRCWALGGAQSDPLHSRRGRGRPFECAARACCIRRGAAAASICAKSRTKSPACRRCRSGATKRRSATSWRSPRPTCRRSLRSASASAARMRSWARRRATGGSS